MFPKNHVHLTPVEICVSSGSSRLQNFGLIAYLAKLAGVLESYQTGPCRAPRLVLQK